MASGVECEEHTSAAVVCVLPSTGKLRDEDPSAGNSSVPGDVGEAAGVLSSSLCARGKRPASSSIDASRLDARAEKVQPAHLTCDTLCTT